MTDPVVFIPDLACDARLFLPQIVRLGVQFSVQIALPVAGETVELMAQAILAQAPARFSVVGQGLGGVVVGEILRLDPARVLRVALIATDPLAEPTSSAVNRENRIVAARAGRMAEAVAAEYPETCLAPDEWRADIQALLADMGETLGAQVFLRQSRAMQRRPDQQRVLRKTNAPALVIGGDRDPLVPVRRQELLAALLPHGELVTIAGVGHMPTLEQPMAVNAALSAFLAAPLPQRSPSRV